MAGNIITYNSLREYILQSLNRNDPRVINQLDNFIMLGERVTSQILEIEGLKKFAKGTTLIGNGLLPKPDRWLNTFSFGIYYNKEYETCFQNYKKLILRTWTYLLEYWPNLNLWDSDNPQPPQSLGQPSQYSDMEYNQLIMVPFPDQNYPFVWGYWEVPELLGPTVSTNFLTEHDPQCLMYASVMEANYFLQNYDEGDKWRQRFIDSMQFTKNVDQRLIADGAQRRDHT